MSAAAGRPGREDLPRPARRDARGQAAAPDRVAPFRESRKASEDRLPTPSRSRSGFSVPMISSSPRFQLACQGEAQQLVGGAYVGDILPDAIIAVFFTWHRYHPPLAVVLALYAIA